MLNSYRSVAQLLLSGAQLYRSGAQFVYERCSMFIGAELNVPVSGAQYLERSSIVYL